jgi:hypothetical protein
MKFITHPPGLRTTGHGESEYEVRITTPDSPGLAYTVTGYFWPVERLQANAEWLREILEKNTRID